VNLNIPVPGTWDLQMGAKNQNGDSFDNRNNFFFLSSTALGGLSLPSQLANNCKGFATRVFMG
jgi:hypothetical protein